MDEEELREVFEKQTKVELNMKDDLAAIFEAKGQNQLGELQTAIRRVEKDHALIEHIEAGLCLIKVMWHEGKIWLLEYTRSAGLTYKPR